jgi:hypothetical protein
MKPRLLVASGVLVAVALAGQPATASPSLNGPTASTATVKIIKAQRFHGNGSRTYLRIHVLRDSYLRWTNSDSAPRLFMLFDEGFNISVSSKSSKGTTEIAAGTYRKVYVAGGSWTFTIVPMKRY